MKEHIFTSESVTEGHPDKICDQISDAVLDAILEQDPNGRVACETVTTTGMVMVMGEIATTAYADIPSIVRKTVERIGYNDSASGFDAKSCAVLTSIDEQSPDIALGVDHSMEYKADAKDAADLVGAGDQGMMFGFACDETPELMPAPISLSHQLAHRLTEVRKDGTLPWLRPDGKTQVTVAYDEQNHVDWCPAIVVSTQHAPEIELKDLREAVIDTVIRPVLPENYIRPETKLYVNPTGRFVVGGPCGDTGLTGRKIIVDTYGGAAAHGGGCFSGKDPTKVDRSAAYMARHVAKNIVAAGLAHKVEVQVAYAIGVADPVSINVETYGTEIGVTREQIQQAVRKVFDLRPAAIIDELDLKRPIYSKTAAYGHFGREDADFTWEATNKVDELKEAIKA